MDPVVLMMMLMAAGYALRLAGYGWLGRGLSRLVFYYLLPPLMFEVFGRRGLPAQSLGMAFIVLGFVGLSMPVLLWASERLGLEGETRASVVMCSAFQNSGFLPFPIALSFYGDLLPAAVYSSVSITLFYIAAGILASLDEGSGWRVMREAFRRVAGIPPLYGIVFGIASNKVGFYGLLPGILHSLLHGAGMLGVYLSAALVGLALPEPRGLLEVTTPVAVILAWRLAASPLIHLALASALMSDDLWFRQALLESIMPPATANTVIAHVYGFDVETTTRSTLIATAVSLPLTYLLRALGIL